MSDRLVVVRDLLTQAAVIAALPAVIALGLAMRPARSTSEIDTAEHVQSCAVCQAVDREHGWRPGPSSLAAAPSSRTLPLPANADAGPLEPESFDDVRSLRGADLTH